MQPVFALSAKRSPLSLPTNMRSPRIAGCERAELTPGNPNAHFSFRRGIIGEVRPLFVGVLKPVVRRRRSPAVPPAGDVRRGDRRRLRRAATDGGRRRSGAHRPAREERGHRLALGVGEGRTLPEHLAARQRDEDAFGREGREDLAVGGS